jgi:hypothetical protein
MVVVGFVFVISSTFLKSEQFSWFLLTKYFLFTGHCVLPSSSLEYIEQSRDKAVSDFLVIFLG